MQAKKVMQSLVSGHKFDVWVHHERPDPTHGYKRFGERKKSQKDLVVSVVHHSLFPMPAEG